MNREELEQEAKELGLKYNPRLSDANLAIRIEESKNGSVVEGEVVPVAGKNIQTFTTSEYAKYSEENGRYMGRPLGVKTKPTTQELRVIINAGWTPKMFMDKHGISEAELTQLVFKLSKEERREVPIKFGKVVVNG